MLFNDPSGIAAVIARDKDGKRGLRYWGAPLLELVLRQDTFRAVDLIEALPSMGYGTIAYATAQNMLMNVLTYVNASPQFSFMYVREPRRNADNVRSYWWRQTSKNIF